MQGDGVPPAEAREFCDWLQSEAPARMDGTCFAVLALGDRRAPGHLPTRSRFLQSIDNRLLSSQLLRRLG